LLHAEHAAPTGLGWILGMDACYKHGAPTELGLGVVVGAGRWPDGSTQTRVPMRTKNMDWVARALCAVLLWVPGCTWAADASSAVAQPGVRTLSFGVFWPPRDPSQPPTHDTEPLLDGRVVLRLESLSDGSSVIRLRVTLTRRSDEAARERWNSRLAFPEYDWMRQVRVWDADQRWLWPNVPYLLRLHGTERVERYGGVDPGKGVDNDFATVLIRKYDADGTQESEDTKRAPLVSAEWYPVGTNRVDKHTIVHTAESDEFTLHPGGAGEARSGWAEVWLIYADFMGAKLPEGWPKEPEYAGGILAYFEVHWSLKAEGAHEVSLRQLAAPRSTGFDWERWATRTRASSDSRSTAKLSDLPTNKVDRPK